MIWASMGLVVLLCAPWLLPSNKLYHQAIIALLWLPALIELVLVRRPRPVLTSPEALLYGLFAVWTLVVIGIEGGDSGRFKLPFYVGLTLLGMLLVARAGLQRFVTLLCACSLFGGLLAGLSWVYFYLYLDHAWGRRLVALGLWDTPIMAAHAVGALAVVGVFLVPTQKGRPWMQWGLLLAGIGYALFLGSSQTRGVWIALLATLVVMAGVTRQRSLLITLVLICSTVLAIFLLEPQVLLQRDVSYRPLLWSGGLQLIREHWLTGVGFHEFFIYLVELDHRFKHPHNMFLNVGVRLGVIGLLCWVALWAAIGWRGWQQRHGELGQSLLALWVFSGVVLLTDGFGPWLKPSADWLVTWVPLGLSLILADAARATPSLNKAS